jgi:pimeloyl-ACP methyl ester carboxylesterase
MPIAAVNGINLSYELLGEGDPFVMIMGLGSSKSTWRFQIPAFKKHYSLVIFDNRGAGNSDKPKGPYSIRQMADDTVGLMEHLGIKKAHVLGVSLGGMIAQELAINYPESVSKLILGCTCACHDESNGRTPEYAKAMRILIESGKIPSAGLIFNKWQYRILGSSLLRRQYGQIKDLEKGAFAAQFEAAGRHNAVERLSRIEAPTLVIVGTGDKAIRPGSSDTLARLIPNSRIVKLDNGSHTFPAEMRATFNREVLSFLKNG